MRLSRLLLCCGLLCGLRLPPVAAQSCVYGSTSTLAGGGSKGGVTSGSLNAVGTAATFSFPTGAAAATIGGA